MKRLSALFLLLFLVCTAVKSQSAIPPLSEKASEMDMIIGEWKAVNKTLRKDGSGQYDLDDQLIIKVSKTLDGHGHRVDWFNTRGEYYGSTLRTYAHLLDKWESRWYDPNKGTWMDEVQWVLEDGVLIHETEMKDETGSYRLRRVHTFSDGGKTYSYQYLRKYQGMNNWLFVDGFTASRIEDK